MLTINEHSDLYSLAKALSGRYGTARLSNGVNVIYQGKFIHFEGTFNGAKDAVQIPNIPARVAVIFSGDKDTCCVLAEPNAGFVNVPSSLEGERFSVFATAILND